MEHITDFDFVLAEDDSSNAQLIKCYAFFRVNGALYRKTFFLDPEYIGKENWMDMPRAVCQGFADRLEHGPNNRHG